MLCLKCGRETDQSFCQTCRETMEKYPIKPNAVVILPKERTPPVSKHAAVRVTNASLERRIRAQSRLLRTFSVALVILLALVIALSYHCCRLLRNHSTKPVGQNYSTVTTAPTESSAPIESTTPTESTGK